MAPEARIGASAAWSGASAGGAGLCGEHANVPVLGGPGRA